MDITFRLQTEADLSVTSDILVAAYHFTGRREEMLGHYLALQPDGWWLALVDGVPVGYGGAVDYGTFSYVGMLSVYPAMQNQGIGGALVKQILGWGKERACPTMFLDAALRAANLYARLGFIDEGETHLLHREASQAGCQPGPGVDLLRVGDISELVTFDAPYFGGERAKIFTSPMVFTPGRAFVTRNEEGRMTGYLFAQSGFLGPWVANNVEDAEKLLRQALSLPLERGATVSIPTENEAGCELLRRYDFRVQSIDRYMRYGDVAQRQRSMIYGQASPALG